MKKEEKKKLEEMKSDAGAFCVPTIISARRRKITKEKGKTTFKKSSGQSQTRRHPTQFCSANTQKNRKEPAVVVVSIMVVVIVSCFYKKSRFHYFHFIFCCLNGCAEMIAGWKPGEYSVELPRLIFRDAIKLYRRQQRRVKSTMSSLK